MTQHKYAEVTNITQFSFIANMNNVVSPNIVGGQHPHHALMRQIQALQSQEPVLLNSYARSHAPLQDVISQYLDTEGAPLVANADQTGGVSQQDKYACFGRHCGSKELCWDSCSLGPSRNPDGSLPVGTEEGEAIPVTPWGDALSQELIQGVVCTQLSPSGSIRHRSDACALLSLFCHVFSIPPAPTSSLSDELYALISATLTHVEQRFRTAIEDSMTSVNGGSPTPTPAPPEVPVSGMPQVPTAGPPTGMAPTEPAPETEVEAETRQTTMTSDSFFVDTTHEQELELKAMRGALIATKNKPKSLEAVNNIIKRNSDTYKKCRNALFKACSSRDMTTGMSLKDKLKAEFWGEVDMPQGYLEEGVPQTTSDAPPPIAPASETIIPVAPTVPAGNVVNIIPGAPAPVQRIDVDIEVESTPEPTQGPEAIPAAAHPDACVGESDVTMASAILAVAASISELAQAIAGNNESKKKSVPKSMRDKQAEPHPQHPEVQKEPHNWQPGSRGRPPKGVTKNKAGEYVLPDGWLILSGLWHPPMK